MQAIIQMIDRALKQLYLLDIPFCAENFLMKHPLPEKRIGTATQDGALFIRGTAVSLEVGIYLSPTICGTLEKLPLNRDPSQWKTAELHGFSVASEEISHFLYLLHHASVGRPVTQLELELQGEIDKFLMLYFLSAPSHRQSEEVFQQLLERIFQRFRLSTNLTAEQTERYLAANRLAKRFLQKYGMCLNEPKFRERAFRTLRRFYRLNVAEKMSLLGPH